MELFIDTETSGLPMWKQPYSHPGQPWIVEIGLMASNEDYEYTEVCLKIKSEGRSIHPKAEKVHGLSTDILDATGVDETLVVAILGRLLQICDKIVCHNTDFDLLMIKSLFYRVGQEMAVNVIEEFPKICTMKSTTDVCKLPGRFGKYKWPKLEELYRFLFNEEPTDLHSALGDVKTTARCYYKLVKDGLI